MSLPTAYRNGSVSVNAGDIAVIGHDTMFLSVLTAGDVLWAPSGNCSIASIESNTTMTLAFPWPGASIIEGVYEVRILGDIGRAQETTRQALERMNDGSYSTPNGTGTLAERADFDIEAQGFIFWQTDVSPFLIFVKQSSSAGDWSSGTSIRGPQGVSGLPGISGVGDKFDIVFWDSGRASANEVVFKAVFATQVNFATNLLGSFAKAGIPSGAQANWSVRKNGVQFGTMRFSAGLPSASFVSSATLFSPGDTLTIVSPTVRDPTLSDVAGVLSGAR